MKVGEVGRWLKVRGDFSGEVRVRGLLDKAEVGGFSGVEAYGGGEAEVELGYLRLLLLLLRLEALGSEISGVYSDIS
jgi:hypothetical protein